MNAARRIFLNSLAFKARNLYISFGIPRVLTIRNASLLRRATQYTKASRSREYATAGQVGGVDRFDTLRQQEFGGAMKNKQPAFKAARGNNHARKITAKNRLRGNILKPSDIRVRGEKNAAHRIAVFLNRIQREKYKDPFIISSRSMGPHSGALGKLHPGLLKLGKKARPIEKYRKRLNKRGKKVKRKVKRLKANYKLITLRSFEKNQKRIRRTRWMKPSNDKLLRETDAKMEWNKAMRYALKRRK